METGSRRRKLHSPAARAPCWGARVRAPGPGEPETEAVFAAYTQLGDCHENKLGLIPF